MEPIPPAMLPVPESSTAPAPKRVSLSLTSTYAPSWGLWEGVREFVQNWHDGAVTCCVQSFGTKCRFERVQASTEGGFAYIAFHPLAMGTAGFRDHVIGVIYYDAGQIRLVNFQVGLGRQVLLLGYSKKAQHNSVNVITFTWHPPVNALNNQNVHIIYHIQYNII